MENRENTIHTNDETSASETKPGPRIEPIRRDESPHGDSANKRYLMLGGAGLIVALLLFFAGFATGREGLSDARRDLSATRSGYTERLSNMQAQTQQIQTKLESAESRNLLYGVRGWLYQAAVELDRRNFGVAQDYLNRASLALEQNDLSASGVDVAAVEELRQNLREMRLMVANDIGDQRKSIIATAEQLDRALEPQQPAG